METVDSVILNFLLNEIDYSLISDLYDNQIYDNFLKIGKNKEEDFEEPNVDVSYYDTETIEELIFPIDLDSLDDYELFYKDPYLLLNDEIDTILNV